MEKIRSEREIRDLAIQACLRNLTAEVLVSDPPRFHRSKTRFLQVDIRDGIHSIIMDAPHGAALEAAKVDTEIEVHFQVSKEFYIFKSVISEITPFELTPGQVLQAIRLKMPEELMLRAKRAHVRVFPDPRVPIHINFRVLRGEPGNLDLEKELPEFEGNVRDISVGGVGLFVSRDQSAPTEVGSLLVTDFDLPIIDLHVRLYAIVRNIREIPEHRAVVYGTQFIRTRDSEESRKCVELIERYIQARQQASSGSNE